MPDEQQVNKLRFGKIGRVASMAVAEIADRIRQELRKRADAVSVGLGFDPCRGAIRTAQPGSPRFFFRGEDVSQIIRLLRERMPEQVEAISKSAEKICEHRFDLLGYQDLNYGREIDWHLDLVHGMRAPRDLWFKIKYLDFASVGDAKITWELNRHQHLVTLAKAYRLTNDPQFASELLAQWHHWNRKNPYPRGINWASSLEVAFRSLSWIWVHFLLNGTPAITTEFRKQWLHAMAISGRHIERYLSTYFSPNTHLLGEAVALFFIGTLCPELHSSARWKHKRWDIVLRESQRQLRSDGTYFEQSTYYHVYALDFLLHGQAVIGHGIKHYRCLLNTCGISKVDANSQEESALRRTHFQVDHPALDYLKQAQFSSSDVSHRGLTTELYAYTLNKQTTDYETSLLSKKRSCWELDFLLPTKH